MDATIIQRLKLCPNSKAAAFRGRSLRSLQRQALLTAAKWDSRAFTGLIAINVHNIKHRWLN